MGLNQGWIYRNQVQPAEGGQTLLDYYSQRYGHSDRATWQARIQQGQVQVDGHPAPPDWVLHPGQRLTYHRPPWQEPPVPLAVPILYEDADLVVVNKPAGLPVLPGGGFVTHTLWHQVRQHYPTAPPDPLHRLGRGTSGIVLLGRTPLAKATLSAALRASTAGQPTDLEKVYYAVIGPSTLPDTFTLTTAIGKVPHPTLGHLYAASPQGKPARSEGKVHCRGAELTWVEIKLCTGRPHQIRIHLAAAGYPLLGDPLYGPGGLPRELPSPGELGAVPGDCGYHLHAQRLTCRHPRSQQRLTIVAPLPPDFPRPDRCD